MSRVQLKKDIEGELTHFDLEGYSTDIKVNIYEGATALQTEETISQPTGSATLTTSSSRRSTSIVVDSAVSFARGDTVVIVPMSGVRFQANILGVNGNTIHLEDPLRVALAIGDTIEVAEISLAIPTTITDELYRDLRSVWSYTDGLGRAKSVTRYFDVVSDPWEPWITEDALATEDPSVGEYVGENVSISSASEGAKGEVENILRRAGLYPDLYRFREDLDLAVINLTLARLYLGSKKFKEAQFFQDKGIAIAREIQNSKAWYDIDDDLKRGLTTDDDIYAEDDPFNQDEISTPINFARVG